jgi:predicted lipase
VIHDYKEYPIVFLGHSLGASLAVLASIGYYLSDYPYQNNQISVVSFGQPRLGNKEFAHSLNQLPYASRIHRIVADGDLIAQIPPKIFGYYHSIGQKTIYPNYTVIDCVEDETTNKPIKCLQSFWASKEEKHHNYFGTNIPCIEEKV